MEPTHQQDLSSHPSRFHFQPHRSKGVNRGQGLYRTFYVAMDLNLDGLTLGERGAPTSS